MPATFFILSVNLSGTFNEKKQLLSSVQKYF
jgi:hypothetical protein